MAGEPGNPFGEITPAVLNVAFGFSHISACVDAFRSVPYPYTNQRVSVMKVSGRFHGSIE